MSICKRCRRLVGRHKLEDGYCKDFAACREAKNIEIDEEDERPLNMLDKFRHDPQKPLPRPIDSKQRRVDSIHKTN